ncbi:DNA-formamidopyrimidine glycosylase family protein, partial [Patescibacteria group bacterium]
MPEYPEVHTITNDLKKHITGFEIKKVNLDPKYSLPNIESRKIKGIKQIAKNIVLELDSDKFLVFHLAMTGRILLRKDKNINDKWVKITLEISKNDKNYYLKFADMRAFGKVQLLDKKGLEELTYKYGPTPLDDLTPKEFLELVKSKKTNVKNVLLDQTYLHQLL